MPKRILERRLDEIRQLGRGDPTAETSSALKKALDDRHNLIVAQAAKAAADLELNELVPNLLSAFDRMMENAATSDPQCRAKLAIISALTRANYSESAVFLRGIRHIQMEPNFGGPEDTAPKLRGTCLLALASCTDITRREALQHVVRAMIDDEEPVRIDAARALEQLEGEESALLLRLKAHIGDPQSGVMGQVFESLLNLEGDMGLSFVSEFLECRDIEICEEAALAIGASRLPKALDVLKDAWSRERGRARGAVILRMMSASARPEAIDYLLSLVEQGEKRDMDAAVKALEFHRDSRDIAERLKEAIKKRANNDGA